jgi:hypothetical protein
LILTLSLEKAWSLQKIHQHHKVEGNIINI